MKQTNPQIKKKNKSVMIQAHKRLQDAPRTNIPFINPHCSLWDASIRQCGREVETHNKPPLRHRAAHAEQRGALRARRTSQGRSHRLAFQCDVGSRGPVPTPISGVILVQGKKGLSFTHVMDSDGLRLAMFRKQDRVLENLRGVRMGKRSEAGDAFLTAFSRSISAMRISS